MPGLISLLSKRVGLLSQLLPLLPTDKFIMLTNGIFYSKLNFCLALYGNVFGLDTMRDTETRFNAFTKANLQALQVLQNKLLRMISSSTYDTPVTQLLQMTGSVSIN